MDEGEKGEERRERKGKRGGIGGGRGERERIKVFKIIFLLLTGQRVVISSGRTQICSPSSRLQMHGGLSEQRANLLTSAPRSNMNLMQDYIMGKKIFFFCKK